jgi:tetrahydrodipicolinate N-succinyltransferase
LGNAQIRENVSIRKKCIISKDVYIDKNVNAFTLVTGNPAVEIAKINKKGFRI